MEEKRIYEMDMVKQEDKKAAKKTPFYQTTSQKKNGHQNQKQRSWNT